MATTPLDLGTIQASDYNASDLSLQDYGALDNSGLAAPSLDSPLGVDPLSGVTLPVPGPISDPFAPSLTVLPPDASNGLNSYNDGLLPLAPAATVDTSVYGTGTNVSTTPSVSSGAGLDLPGNLPLAPVTSGTLTLLGSAIAKSNPNPAPLGSSIWNDIFGTAASVASVAGGPKAGTAGIVDPKTGLVPGNIKALPKTAIGNPISGTTGALVIGVTAALIGMIIWSFSGAR